MCSLPPKYKQRKTRNKPEVFSEDIPCTFYSIIIEKVTLRCCLRVIMFGSMCSTQSMVCLVSGAHFREAGTCYICWCWVGKGWNISTIRILGNTLCLSVTRTPGWGPWRLVLFTPLTLFAMLSAWVRPLPWKLLSYTRRLLKKTTSHRVFSSIIRVHLLFMGLLTQLCSPSNMCLFSSCSAQLLFSFWLWLVCTDSPVSISPGYRQTEWRHQACLQKVQHQTSL